jgi:hypothetical protein
METNKPRSFSCQPGIGKLASGALHPSKLNSENLEMCRVRAAHTLAVEGRLAGVLPPLKGAFKPVKLPFSVLLGSYIVIKYSVSITYI